MTIKNNLRELIGRKNLSRLAREADVPYHALYRWFSGTGDKLDADLAQKLIVHLTEEASVESGDV